ncbi:MAG: hypothetical protein LBL73_09760 [Synergistaceae bacterium]|jgi:hypothetical protein|nr:hypothetical protein [Synergistaceae bacterium]
MSKPTTPGELRNVRVDSISLVTKAANRKTFKIFKSAETDGPQAAGAEADASDGKDERGLFRALKAYFSGPGAVEKGALADTFNAREKGRKLGVAVDALWSVLKLNRWGENDEKAVTDAKAIRGALADFVAIAEKTLLGKDEDLVKAAEEVAKSGRKISGARLAEIAAARDALSKLIDEAGEQAGGEGDTGVTKEEIAKAVKECVDEAVKPFGDKLAALEKDAGGDGGAQGGNTEDSAGEMADIVKAAVEEATAPLGERIEKLEKARGMRNSIPEDASVRKDGTDDLWGDVF